jgi:hypothetical protein
VEEEAGARLVAYLPHIMPYISAALDRYQARSTIVLLDTIGTMADSVKEELARPEYLNEVMPKVRLTVLGKPSVVGLWAHAGLLFVSTAVQQVEDAG